MLLSTIIFTTLIVADPALDRPVQNVAAWQRNKQDLLWGFGDMYQPCVVESRIR
jgi:hypothetical protein